VAVICFALAGQIRWPQAVVMSVGAALRGYLAGRLVRRR